MKEVVFLFCSLDAKRVPEVPRNSINAEISVENRVSRPASRLCQFAQMWHFRNAWGTPMIPRGNLLALKWAIAATAVIAGCHGHAE